MKPVWRDWAKKGGRSLLHAKNEKETASLFFIIFLEFQ